MKISHKEYAQIMNYKHPHHFKKIICNFYSEPLPLNRVRVRAVVKLPIYLLIFIPVHIAQFFMCLWDGGLREFTFEGREISNHVMDLKQE